MQYPIPMPRPIQPQQQQMRPNPLQPTPFTPAPQQNAMGKPPLMQRLANNHQAFLQMGMGLLGGQTGPEQFALGAQGLGNAVQGMKEKREAETTKNRTLEFLKTADPEIAAAVEAGALSGGDGYKLYLQNRQGSKPTSGIQEYEFAKSQGYDGSFMDYQMGQKKAGATNVTVGGGKYGTIPSGMELIETPEGARLVPIKGGPVDMDNQKAAAQAKIGQDSKARSGNVVIEDIDRALEKMNDGGLPTAGAVGGMLSNFPGTDAYNVGSLIQTVKANSGFDRLQAMRDASPTGGALGAINQSEMGLLQSALGNLEQSQSKEQLEYNLKRVRDIYDEIVNGPGGAQANPSAGGAADPLGIR